jgi:hypothetical protein
MIHVCPKRVKTDFTESEAKPSVRHRQLTLQISMAIIVACAILFAWVRSQGSVLRAVEVAAYSRISWGLCFLTAFAVARKFGPIVRSSTGRATIWVFLTTVGAAAFYLMWAYSRARFDFVHGLDHDFPYPDRALNALARWFDARHPVPRGSLKMHGEWPRVTVLLGMIVLILAGIAGFLFGVVSNWGRTVSTRDQTLTDCCQVDHESTKVRKHE